MGNRGRNSPKKSAKPVKGSIVGFQVQPGSPGKKGSEAGNMAKDNVLTDGQIAKSKRVGQYGRELVRWDAGEENISTPLNNDRSNQKSNKDRNGVWDQFAANEVQFGVKTSWNENAYTTKLDKSKAKISEADAERIAHEIETKNARTNHRLANAENDDGDEEAKYSAVLREQPAPAQAQTQPGRSQSSAPAWSNAATTLATIGTMPFKPANGTPPEPKVNQRSRPMSSMPVSVDQRKKEYRAIHSELGQPSGNKKNKISPSGSRLKNSPTDSKWLGENSQVRALDLHVGLPRFDASTRREFDDFKKSKGTGSVQDSQSPEEKSLPPAVSSDSLAGATQATAPSESPIIQTPQAPDTQVPITPQVESSNAPSRAASQDAGAAVTLPTVANTTLSSTIATHPAPETQDPVVKKSTFTFNPNAAAFVPRAASLASQSQRQSPVSSQSNTPKNSGGRRTQFNKSSQGYRQNNRNGSKLSRPMEGGPSGARYPHQPISQAPVTKFEYSHSPQNGPFLEPTASFPRQFSPGNVPQAPFQQQGYVQAPYPGQGYAPNPYPAYPPAAGFPHPSYGLMPNQTAPMSMGYAERPRPYYTQGFTAPQPLYYAAGPRYL